MKIDTNWWQEFYNDKFSECTLSTEPQKIAKFINKVSNIKNNSLIYDQCCGNGAISHELSKLYQNIVGVDFSKYFIDYANKNYSNKNCLFICDDAKSFLLNKPADFVLNWRTSFAYDENDEENVKMIQTLSKNLKSEGEFIINVINPDYVANYFQRFWVREIPHENGTIIAIKEHFIEDSMSKSKWLIIYPDGARKEYFGQTKMYSLEDYKDMFKKYNLEILKVYGNMDLEEFNENSQELIIYGKKKC